MEPQTSEVLRSRLAREAPVHHEVGIVATHRDGPGQFLSPRVVFISVFSVAPLSTSRTPKGLWTPEGVKEGRDGPQGSRRQCICKESFWGRSSRRRFGGGLGWARDVGPVCTPSRPHRRPRPPRTPCRTVTSGLPGRLRGLSLGPSSPLPRAGRTDGRGSTLHEGPLQ